MESARSGRPVANQFVISDTKRMIFQSYDSMIVDIDFFNSKITFGKDWNYSTTTAKYRNQFLDMYFPSLADTKKLKELEKIKAELIGNSYLLRCPLTARQKQILSFYEADRKTIDEYLSAINLNIELADLD